MNDPRIILRPCLPLLLAFGLSAPAIAQEPLSASDWLSGSLRGPVRESSSWRPGERPPTSLRNAPGNPRPIAASGSVGRVHVTRLGEGNSDAAGTQTARRAGLPADLWQGSDVETLIPLLSQSPARLPAMNILMQRILTAQLQPPTAGSSRPGRLFLVRADRLLDMGALNRAQELLTAAGTSSPEVFRRLFDIALLEGDEVRACDMMNSTPGIAPSFSARIFCLAQTGDWAAAAISLHGAEAMGLINPDQAQLLTHFLDDAFVDTGEALEPADPMTPLDFRIHEAVGQPLPTAGLPVAFAQSDLRANSGWKARLEAAERLVRIGAIPPQRMRAIYAEQKPAASGGVWERAGAMRRLEAAIAAGNATSALPHTFDEFLKAGMAGTLAAMVAQDLPDAGTTPDITGDRAAEITAWLRQWQGLPVTTPQPYEPALDSGSTPPPDGRKGEVLLAAMADIDAGVDGDLTRAGRGLAVLRGLGLTADADLAMAQLSLLSKMSETPG